MWGRCLLQLLLQCHAGAAIVAFVGRVTFCRCHGCGECFGRAKVLQVTRLQPGKGKWGREASSTRKQYARVCVCVSVCVSVPMLLCLYLAPKARVFLLKLLQSLRCAFELLLLSCDSTTKQNARATGMSRDDVYGPPVQSFTHTTHTTHNTQHTQHTQHTHNTQYTTHTQMDSAYVSAASKSRSCWRSTCPSPLSVSSSPSFLETAASED